MENPFEDPFNDDPFQDQEVNLNDDNKINKDSTEKSNLDIESNFNNLDQSIKNNIIIRTEVRNARKYTTSVVNFPEVFNSKDFISLVKKKCQVNGSIKNSKKCPDKKDNIEFSGKINKEIENILLNKPYNISKELILIQGV